MTWIDWAIVVVYFVMSAAIGAYFARRAGRSVEDFFLSGRSLPWWLAGTSMVATTFAADTPLAVTELVAKNGIAGNWLWWNMALGGMATVFFFARLWRRAGILTDVELLELRYSGKPAAVLRGVRGLYLGLFINCVIMGWVNLAMASILEGMLGVPHAQVLWWVGGTLAITAVYSAMSGLWGVAVTDAFQFVLAMTGTIVLAVIVVSLPQVGGIAGLKAHLPSWTFSLVPEVSATSPAAAAGGALAMSAATFFAFIGIQWWASWYPGAEPGGGGFVAQRMMSARDERHAVFATLWFTVAHYCVRPWPWIVTGLATLVLYPELAPEAKRLGYVYAMRDHLPVGLKGVLVASFLAAYMSTISTQLNWGTSYVVHDVYRRFIRPEASERQLVRLSRITTLVFIALSLGVTAILDTISGAWLFIIEAGAGLGLVLILRWFWWRVNAWSELTAMVVPLAVYGFVRVRTSIVFPESLYLIVGATTLAWIAATYLTRPVETERLVAFYRRVRPAGPGWGPIRARCPEVEPGDSLGRTALDWIAGVALVYAALFTIGSVVFGEWARAAWLAAVVVLCAFWIGRSLSRQDAGAA
jgi:SSS family solute:Na+ symporter